MQKWEVEEDANLESFTVIPCVSFVINYLTSRSSLRESIQGTKEVLLN